MEYIRNFLLKTKLPPNFKSRELQKIMEFILKFIGPVLGIASAIVTLCAFYKEKIKNNILLLISSLPRVAAPGKLIIKKKFLWFSLSIWKRELGDSGLIMWNLIPMSIPKTE